MIFTRYTFDEGNYYIQEIETQDTPEHSTDLYCQYKTVTPYEAYPGDSIECYETDLYVPINDSAVLEDDYSIFYTIVFEDGALTTYGRNSTYGEKYIILKGTEEETSKHAMDVYNRYLLACIEKLHGEIKRISSYANPKKKEV